MMWYIWYYLISLAIISCSDVRKKLKVTIAIVLKRDNGNDIDQISTLPAIELAIERSKAVLPYFVFINYSLITDDINCSGNLVAAGSSHMYFINRMDVFIGPACSQSMRQLGRLASDWNIPIFTGSAWASDLSDKSEFRTLTRFICSSDNVARFFLSLLKHFNWTDISVIWNATTPGFIMLSESVQQVFRKTGTFVNSLYFSFNKPGEDCSYLDCKRILDQISPSSRVIFLLMDVSCVREFLKKAEELKMITAEYVYISFSDEPIHKKFKKDDTIGLDSLLPIDLFVDHQFSEYVNFIQEIKNRTSLRSNYVWGPDQQPHREVKNYYDSVMIYLQVISEMINENADWRNGHEVVRRIWNRTYKGIANTFYIDSIGEQSCNLAIFDWDNDAGKFQESIRFVGLNNSFVDIRPIHWPGGRGPPNNEPPCGFNHDKCSKYNSTLLMVLLCLSIAALSLVILAVYLYRNKIVSINLNWDIPFEDITILNTKSVISMNCFCIPNKILSFDVGLYKGQLVALKALSLSNNKLYLTKKIIAEVQKVRMLSQPNLNQCFGICCQKTEKLVIWEYLPKNSLKDVLDNEVVCLDWLFKYSFIGDLIEGMTYLHSSAVEFHGHLTSFNCLLDGRFTLKITDFGFPIFKKIEEIAPKYNLLWIAPEFLHSNEEFVGSQQGDIYSFAIILQEIITTDNPFLVDIRDEEKVNKILDQVKSTTTTPFRPIVAQDVIPSALFSIMESSWTENPNNRPCFKKISMEFGKLKRNSGNVVESLLYRLEQYSSNLENTVISRTDELLEEKRKVEILLSQLLPGPVAEKLIQGQTVLPEWFDSVTVFCSDIIGFTSICAKLSPLQVVHLLNDLYILFDETLENFDVYKIETIGDAYIVASGLPKLNGNDHVREIALMALALVQAVRSFRISFLVDNMIKIRIGIHSGFCVAGVVGLKMPRYCLIGETITIATKLESLGEALKIHVSQSSKELLDSFQGFHLVERGNFNIRGTSNMKTYWILEQ